MPVLYPALRGYARAVGCRRRRMMAGEAAPFQAYTRTPMPDNGRKHEGALGTLPPKRPGRGGIPRAARPAAVKPASPPLRPAHETPRPIGAPEGAELVATSIRAAGELAQIGLTVGGQMLKRTLDRVPRP